MKALKIILGIVIVLIAIVAILGLIAPKEFGVERSVAIDAPKELVFEHVSSLQAMDTWSPWNELDPNQTKTYEGEAGEVGSLIMWEGNEDVGKGKQEITNKTDSRVDLKLTFIEPWESTSDVSVEVSEAEEGTIVTWSMSGENPFPSNIIGLMMDMDKMIGGDFDRGLGMLKEQVEKAAAEHAAKKDFGGYTIEETELAVRTYIGYRDEIGWDAMKKFYETNLPKAYAEVSKAGLEPDRPSGVFFKWDEENNMTDLLAGVSVMGDQSVGAMARTVVSGKAIMVEYFGPYEGTGKAHMAMEEYLKWHNLSMNGPAIEEYITDPETEEDPSKWQTNIYYVLD